MGALLIDQHARPDEAAVDEVLGPSAGVWHAARERIARDHAPTEEVWAWSKAAGWSMRIRRGERVIVYLTPWEHECRAGIVVGEKAAAAAAAANASPAVLERLETAPRYAEGRGIRFELRTAEDVETLAALARFKMRS